MPTDHPDLTKLANAVEQAWEWLYQQDGWTTLDDAPQEALRELHRATGKLVAARRTARVAGYVDALVSKEAVAQMRKAQFEDHPQLCEEEQWKAFVLLARDLAALLKEPVDAAPLARQIEPADPALAAQIRTDAGLDGGSQWYWRVVFYDSTPYMAAEWQAWSTDHDGKQRDALGLPWPTRKQAEADGAASGLPEWEP
jgi:hypothetical protein